MTHNVIIKIQEDNDWRNGEFAKFKLNSSKVDKTLWNRMCVPMIYAHWEGFVVSSLRILIGYLNELELSPNNINTELIVFGLGKTYNSLKGKQSFEQKITFTNKFKDIQKKAIKFEKNVDTKSNLNKDVLNELCLIFGFKFEKFDDVVTDINRIINIRNRIAHGENSILPTADNITKYVASITDATDILLMEIDTFLTEESYLLKAA